MYFQQAIMESNPASLTYRTPQQMNRYSETFASLANCKIRYFT